MISKVVNAIFLLRDTLICFLGTCEKNFGKIIFRSLLHKKEHIMLLPLFFQKKFWRVTLVSAIDLPLVQAGMHRLYTGHITHWTRFGIKYYAKNIVPVFCVSCNSVQELETQSCCCIVDVRAYSAFFNINVKVTTTTDERPRAFRLGS